MISYELFTLFLGKGVERVKGTSKVALESVAGSDYFSHDFVSLFVGDAWGKGVTSEVTANSDTG